MAFKGRLYVNTEDAAIEGPLEDKSCFIFEFDHNVYMPYDHEDNKLQSTRRITAFLIVKEIDPMTPQLYKIVCDGTLCTEVKIVLYHIEGSTEVPYFNYTLTNARCIEVKNYMPFTKIKSNENIGHMEQVKFLAETFKWEHPAGKTKHTEKAVGATESTAE